MQHHCCDRCRYRQDVYKRQVEKCFLLFLYCIFAGVMKRIFSLILLMFLCSQVMLQAQNTLNNNFGSSASGLKMCIRDRYKAEWTKANPELAAKMDFWFSGKIPQIDWNAIEQKANAATRAASATVLGVLATEVENMIVSSADLSNSDKTDGFLKKTHAFTYGDFSGAFLQAGVSELTMACCCLGMVLHGGIIAACATFFVFSDYMKPAIRMARCV